MAALLLASSASFAAADEEPADRPWKVHQIVPALFPQQLLEKGIKRGAVRMRVSILSTGELSDALVIASSDPAFSTEALRVVRLWRFEPARAGGRPIGVVGDIGFQFELGHMLALDLRGAERLDVTGENAPRGTWAVELSQLDRVPATTHVVQPIYMQAWIDRGLRGSATIEFYIDETGRTRVPSILASTDDLLGAAAASAIAEWTFEPPVRTGRPVLARAEQTFNFEPPAKK